MSYRHTSTVRYETEGLLSPRLARDATPRLHGIEFLRFLAVLCIVLGNIFPGRASSDAPFDNLKAWGYSMHSLLFALSGFILAYNYAPYFDTERFPTTGFDWKQFIMRRMIWLYPVYLMSIFLPIWRDPILYAGDGRSALKLTVTALGASGYWPPSFRTYHVNDGAWTASTYIFFYVIAFPLFLRPLHDTLPRRARKWLLVFLWPWTWFVGFVAHRLDELTRDHEVHWDFTLPLFYLPVFLMGVLTGSIFCERDIDRKCGMIQAIWYRIAGTVFFTVNVLIITLFSPYHLFHWHQTGSLTLLHCLMIYALSNEKDVLGRLFSFYPLRVLGGMSFAVFILQHAIHPFAKDLGGVFAVAYLVSLFVVAFMARVFVQIPYARWALRSLDSEEDEEGVREPHVDSLTGRTAKTHATVASVKGTPRE